MAVVTQKRVNARYQLHTYLTILSGILEITELVRIMTIMLFICNRPVRTIPKDWIVRNVTKDMLEILGPVNVFLLDLTNVFVIVLEAEMKSQVVSWDRQDAGFK